MSTVAVICSSSDNSAIRYILLVMWMSLCFHIMGHLMCGLGNVDIGTMLPQAVVNVQCIRWMAPLFAFVVVYGDRKLRTGVNSAV